MWGNNTIKDLDLWGIPEINFVELAVNNKVYCMYITDKSYTCEFELNTNTKVGQYLLQTLPNYSIKNSKLVLIPEHIKVVKPPFTDLDSNTYKYVVFGDINKANELLNVIKEFTENFNTNKLIEYWNSVDIDMPYFWCELANLVCKNNYAAKKHLKPKNISYTYDLCEPLVHNVNINNPIWYIYGTYNKNDDYYLDISTTKPEGTNFSLNFINPEIRPFLLGKKLKLKIHKAYSNVLTLECTTNKFAFLSLDIIVKGSMWRICINKYNEIILEPVKSKPLGIHPISGFIKTDFKIICPECEIETDLDILACRSEYFKTFKNSEIGNKNSIDSQWNLINLVTFILETKCEFTDIDLELKIADYYVCPAYKIYLKNWLKVNDLAKYHKIYHNIVL